MLALTTGALLATGCKRTEEVAPVGSATDLEVNTWMLKTMRQWYYWNDKIPANPDLSQKPADFFNSILYKFDATARPDGDRFSWANPNVTELTSSLNGEIKSTGIEYQLYYRAQGSQDVIGSVLYVQRGSPAEKAGLQRGAIFYSVNGQRLTAANYQALLFSNADSYVFGMAQFQNGQLVDTQTSHTVTALVLQEDPIYLDSIYSYRDRKIGYLVYNRFIPGPNGSSVPTFDNKLEAIFGKFKAAGVNELILDFRYNPGGQGTSAVKLASMIAPGISSSTVFARREYNKTLTASQLSQAFGAGYQGYNFSEMPTAIGSNLKRVYVLTTNSTASASELIINGLQPFMAVTTIGTTTSGKNVGSVTLSDPSRKISWGLQPIFIKIYNAAGKSDYTDGFKPAVEIKEPLQLRPLGDVSEPMLSEAIAQITGIRPGAGGRQASQLLLPVVASSIDYKAGGMIVEGSAQ